MADENVKASETNAEDSNVDENLEKKVDESTEETVEETEEGKESAEESGEKKEQPKPQRNRIQERINEITAHKRTAEKQVQEWMGIVEEITGEEAPVRANFKTTEEWNAAVHEYREKLKVPETMLRKAKSDVARADQSFVETLVATWDEKIAVTAKDLTDYKEVVSAAKVPLTESLTLAIMSSDIGPRIVYHLSKPENADLAWEILSLSSYEQARAIGNIEAELRQQFKALPKADNKKKEPNPPPGAKSKGAGGSLKKDPGQMTAKEYREWRESSVKK